jgi:hypothetical protein
MTINLGKALNFPFSDKEWPTKFAITVVLIFIPILGWGVLGGYVVRLIRNIMAGEEKLPEFGDWGADFRLGIMAFVGGLIYNAPLILLSCCSSTVLRDNLAVQCSGTVVSIIYGVAIAPF